MKAIQFAVPIQKLKAVNVFSSKEEVRYYLNGVYVDIDESVCTMVATDGHRLIKIDHHDESYEGDKFKGIIPRQIIDKIKITRGMDDALIHVAESGKITIEYDGDSFSGELVDGTYPDYTRVIPKVPKNNKGAAQMGFNPKYLADFEKINSILGYKTSGIKMIITGEREPVIITRDGGISEYFAVLMPLRVA
jgi:DNA polymerase III sliding clamp (beta) subunit (PCNA family)